MALGMAEIAFTEAAYAAPGLPAVTRLAAAAAATSLNRGRLRVFLAKACS
jgi:hypothetical protein